MLQGLVSKLYAAQPTRPLFHYTTLGGLIGIAKDKAIWATDYRYLNDSAEVEFFLDVVDSEIGKRFIAGQKGAGHQPQGDNTDTSGSLDQQQSYVQNQRRVEEALQKQRVLEEFRRWLRAKKINDGSVLVASFIEDGDLLSQWRGYSDFGKGVSISFDPTELITSASGASAQIGECIYEAEKVARIAADIIDAVLKLADQANSSAEFDKLFDEIQTDLFKTAALIKHPKFAEEREWRLVLAVRLATSLGMKFREGATYLIPYVHFPLPPDGHGVKIQQVFVGPTATPELSRASMDHYLRSLGLTANVHRSSIPYRGK